MARASRVMASATGVAPATTRIGPARWVPRRRPRLLPTRTSSARQCDRHWARPVRRVRADGDQPRGARPQGLERLHPDDLTGTRTADEALHPPIGEDDGAVAEVCRQGGRRATTVATANGRRSRVSTATRSKNAWGLSIRHHPIAARSRAARSFNGSRLPESCPWNSWAITLARLEIARPRAIEQRGQPLDCPIVSPRGLFRQPVEVGPLELLLGQRAGRRNHRAASDSPRAIPPAGSRRAARRMAAGAP